MSALNLVLNVITAWRDLADRIFSFILAWLAKKYKAGALVFVGQVLLPIFVTQFILFPKIVKWYLLLEPRPAINVSFVNRETGERTHLDIPDDNNDSGFGWHTSSFSDLLAQKSRRTDRLLPTLHVELSLYFHRTYLHEFFQKPWLLARRQMQMLRNYPVWSVHFWDLSVHWSELRRWRLLCQTLGSIPTLDAVTFKPLRQYDGRAAVGAIECMSQISQLILPASFFGEMRDERVFDEFAQALRRLSRLSWLQFDLFRNVSHSILSAVSDSSLLQTLSITDEHDEGLSFESSKALSQFLQVSTVSTITLHDLQFSSESACHQFCQGVCKSRVKSITVTNIKVSNDGEFARSLAASPEMTRLFLSCWAHPASLHAFLSNLARVLPETNLEALDLQYLYSGRPNGDNHDGLRSVTESVQPFLIRGAARCSTLLELKLPYASNDVGMMDEALACLMESSCSRLQTLVLGRPLRRPGKSVAVSYPRFLEALKGNVTIQHVHLAPIHAPNTERFRAVYTGSTWCGDFEREVGMVTRLNRAGRNYLKSNERSHNEGVRVLEKVNDNLDCVFFHLREIPTIVKG